MKKYPRIGTTRKRSKNNSAKCACGAIGKFEVHIEHNYMRGDDSVVWACLEHVKDLEFLIVPHGT